MGNRRWPLALLCAPWIPESAPDSARPILAEPPRYFTHPSPPPEVVVSTTAARASGRSGISSRPDHAAQELADLLIEVRHRTMQIVAPLTREDAVAQHDPLMSPVVWDLGHIALFEELWLLRHLEGSFDGAAPLAELPGTFNPFEHPRRTRGSLTLPGLDEAREMLTEIRQRVFDRLAQVEIGPDAPPLTRDGYVYRMVAQHEAQHAETILQALQLKRGDPYHPMYRPTPPRGSRSLRKWFGSREAGFASAPTIEAQPTTMSGHVTTSTWPRSTSM